MVHSPVKNCVVHFTCKGKAPGEFGPFLYISTLSLDFWNLVKSWNVEGKLE